jgi:hypothetical protein
VRGIALESPIFDIEMIEGHKVIDCYVYLKGICKNCFLKTGKKTFLNAEV